MNWFVGLGPIGQAFIATLGTYLLTVIGTLPVLLFRSAPRRLMDSLMGFAGGVMVAAAAWSLLQPAMERGGVLPAAVGLPGSHRRPAWSCRPAPTRNLTSHRTKLRLRSQSLDRPAAIVLLRILKSIVHAIAAALPEFDFLGDYTIAAPE